MTKTAIYFIRMTCDRCKECQEVKIDANLDSWANISVNWEAGDAILSKREGVPPHLCKRCVGQFLEWWEGGRGPNRPPRV